MTQEELVLLLNYNPDTGEFSWAVDRGEGRYPAGTKAGTKNGHGYSQIKINQKIYQSHRLAWLYFYGASPSLNIDHINGDRSDNRISNLRLANPKQNNANRKKESGLKGASFNKKQQRWVGRCGRIHLGSFDTELEAHMAYRVAAGKAYGQYARYE